MSAITLVIFPIIQAWWSHRGAHRVARQRDHIHVASTDTPLPFLFRDTRQPLGHLTRTLGWGIAKLCPVLAVSLMSLLSACSHPSPSRPPAKATPTISTPSQAPLRTAPAIEAQLLDTIRHAENLGKGNPLVLTSLYSLASYYRSVQEYEKAERQYQKALTLKEELSGPNHPDIAAILKNYAAMLKETGRDREAAALATRAAKILGMPKPSHATTPAPSRQ